VSAATASEAERLLRQLDEAAYGPAPTLGADIAERALRVVRTVDGEALPRREVRLPRYLVLIAAAALPLATGTVRAISIDAARRSFERGVSAYEQRQFAVARSAFTAVTREEPWAPDAWANLGTAAWAANDTASAAAGWQRALRLEPTATDLRDRLQLAEPNSFGSIGFVAPVSSAVAFWVAAAAWCFAWFVAAVLAFRRRTPHRIGIRRWAYAFGLTGVLLLLAALDLDQRQAARNLAVIRSTSRISSDPALGGETRGTAVIGEVARALRREGAWTLVALDDQREGWIESTRLISLERGTVTD
jgi:hypothetical protein